jgi:hypothetical protein
MSNTWFNLMVFGFHIQMEHGRWLPRFSYNKNQAENNFPDGYIKLYD